MTGKEALINLSKTCMAYQEEFGRLKIDKKDNEALQVLLNIVQKYDKYKRAFEILKDKLAIEPMKDEKECWFYFKNVYSNGYTDYVDLNSDECELLEELMKSE